MSQQSSGRQRPELLLFNILCLLASGIKLLYNHNMHTLRFPFRGLSWKLTLSYTLVTVAALLVVEAVLLGAVLIFIMDVNLLPRFAAQSFFTISSQLYPYLSETPPNIDAINYWLRQGATRGYSSQNQQGQNNYFFPGSFNEGDGQILVMDSQRNLLAGLPASGPGLLSKPIQEDQEVTNLLSTAKSGVTDFNRLYHYSPEKRLVIVAPVKTVNKPTVGYLIFRGTLVPQNMPYGQLFSLMGSSLVFFTLAAGTVGTVFGFFTARGLTRRLKVVSHNASEWGKGDFSHLIQDASDDEIGKLGRQLNEMASQLQNLLRTRQDLAALEERNRLARDLHDSVKQQTFAISMNLGAAQALWERDPDGARQRLDEAATLARQAQRELTALIQTLRPIQLEGKGLIQALREYVQSWERQTGISATYESGLEQAFPSEVEQSVFRVAQEALSNVARHSGASQVKVCLSTKFEQACNQATLEITDNGHGFDPHQHSSGLGLHSIRERIQAQNGILEIESSSNGTRIITKIPLS